MKTALPKAEWRLARLKTHQYHRSRNNARQGFLVKKRTKNKKNSWKCTVFPFPLPDFTSFLKYFWPRSGQMMLDGCTCTFQFCVFSAFLAFYDEIFFGLFLEFHMIYFYFAVHFFSHRSLHSFLLVVVSYICFKITFRKFDFFCEIEKNILFFLITFCVFSNRLLGCNWFRCDAPIFF